MKKDSVILVKSKAFAIRIIRMYQYLVAEKREYIMAKQVLRSGTSIGANVREGSVGQTKADFYAKMNIALKEACETEYWLELLHETGYLSTKAFSGIYADCDELVSILTSITKTQYASNS